MMHPNAGMWNQGSLPMQWYPTPQQSTEGAGTAAQITDPSAAGQFYYGYPPQNAWPNMMPSSGQPPPPPGVGPSPVATSTAAAATSQGMTPAGMTSAGMTPAGMGGAVYAGDHSQYYLYQQLPAAQQQWAVAPNTVHGGSWNAGSWNNVPAVSTDPNGTGGMPQPPVIQQPPSTVMAAASSSNSTSASLTTQARPAHSPAAVGVGAKPVQMKMKATSRFGKNKSRWDTPRTTPNKGPAPVVQPGQSTADTTNTDQTNNPSKKSEEWPPAMRDYVQEAFERCKTKLEKDRCEEHLRKTLEKVFADGSAWKIDWASLPKVDPSKLEPNSSKQAGRVSRWETPSGRGRGRGRGGFFSRDNSPPRSAGRRNYWRRSRSRSRSRSPRRRGSRSSSSDYSRSPSPSPRSRFLPDTKRGRGRGARGKAAAMQSKKSKRKAGFQLDVDDAKLENRVHRFVGAKVITAPKRETSIIDQIKQMNNYRGSYEELDWSEMIIVGTCQKLEKPYLRLTSAPDPSQVRPEKVLRKTLELVKSKWKAGVGYVESICEQFKSIRQDLTVQCIRNRFTIEVYETHARTALEAQDRQEYNQCQAQLKVLYQEVEGDHAHEDEFAAYRILYCLLALSVESLEIELKSLSEKSEISPCVVHALSVHEAWALCNYRRFFKLYDSTPHMGSYLLDFFLPRQRLAAVRSMVKA